ncbi:MAG TPA: hypothetical protein DEP18_07825 [Flavobacteriales bacterium]|nr:hypothetical protein [Flavobacteriales bacterium]HCA83681.1 hypothetical protein [Flavobacteriales bacterium]HRE74950.1 hypothetical protein [Flavobacteriales bacterium]HRE95429.1 hypothetical protein [Flavobacteriales bacterium]HRJ34643.1 hypothetical protein [Flavobacteriales bacterium]
MMETENGNSLKATKKKFDKAIFAAFFAGVVLIATAVALKSIKGESQFTLVLIAAMVFLLASVLMFMKSYYTGKKYAVGAKKRRKKYLTVMYGESSVFSKATK